MPVGYLVPVAVVAAATLFALRPMRRSRPLAALSFRLGLLINEVPIAGFYWLLIATLLTFGQGDIGSPGGWATVGLAGLVTVGLGVIAWRGLRAGPVIERALTEGLGAGWRTSIDAGTRARFRRRPPYARILFRPFFPRRRDVERVKDIAYGDAGRRQLLDVYRRRSHPSGAPVLIHLHRGGYRGGRKNTQSLPLLFEDADTSVTAAICLNGYYGAYYGRGADSSPLTYVRPDAPPFFIAHGDHDTVVPVENARLFADTLRGGSTGPVVYAELPGAQHAFDLFHSLRFETLIDAIESFTAWVRTREKDRSPRAQGDGDRR